MAIAMVCELLFTVLLDLCFKDSVKNCWAVSHIGSLSEDGTTCPKNGKTIR